MKIKGTRWGEVQSLNNFGHIMTEVDMEMDDNDSLREGQLQFASENDNATEKDEKELVDTLEDTFVEEAEDPVPTYNAGDPSTPPVHHPRAKRSKIAKKIPSKWIVYLGEQRKAVIDANPGVSFADITKMIAEQYKALPAEELERIQAVIDQEKARRAEADDGADEDAIDEDKPKPEQSVHTLVLPMARIKRLMKMDEDVKIISKEAIAVTTKATELFVARFALKCASTTSLRGGRTVGINDVLHTIHGQSQFQFLDLDFPKPIPIERNKASKPANLNKIPVKHTKEANARVAKLEMSNGKYSMLNFVSGSKRSADEAAHEANEANDDNEQDEEMEVVTKEISETDQGELIGDFAADEDQEEATRQSTKPEVVDTSMDW